MIHNSAMLSNELSLKEVIETMQSVVPTIELLAVKLASLIVFLVLLFRLVKKELNS
jgi:uncharacterized membrane protein